MDESRDLTIALRGALVGFLFALLGLIARDALERLRERQRRKEELRALLDLYLTEIVSGTQRCVQFVRQVCLHEVSRSKLSLPIGPSKLDRVGALGASPRCVRGLHAIYRLFDQVAYQAERRDPGDFRSIFVHVQAEYHLLTTGFKYVLEEVLELHGVKPRRLGRRLLGKLTEALFRARRELLSGVPAHKEGALTLREIRDLQQRFETAANECMGWFAAWALTVNLAEWDGEPGKLVLEAATGGSVAHRAMTLRTIEAVVRARFRDVGVRHLSEELKRLFHAANTIIGYSGDWASTPAQLDQARAAWRGWLQEKDPQPYDG